MSCLYRALGVPFCAVCVDRRPTLTGEVVLCDTEIPIVSIVVPCFGLTNSILRIPKGNPKKELLRSPWIAFNKSLQRLRRLLCLPNRQPRPLVWMLCVTLVPVQPLKSDRYSPRGFVALLEWHLLVDLLLVDPLELMSPRFLHKIWVQLVARDTPRPITPSIYAGQFYPSRALCALTETLKTSTASCRVAAPL